MKYENAKVEVKVNDKTLLRTYKKTVVETFDDAVAQVTVLYDKVRDKKVTADSVVWEVVTYALDLKVRADIRQQIMATEAGPEKALEKAFKDLVAGFIAAGIPEETATTLAETQMATVRAAIESAKAAM